MDTLHIYVGYSFFYAPKLFYQDEMNSLRSALRHWDYFQVSELLVPVRGDFHEDSWHERRGNEFLAHAHAVIVDTTHMPGVHERLIQILHEHNIFVISCKQAVSPRPEWQLNVSNNTAHVAYLEYRDHITDLKSHILTHLTRHHFQLQCKKA